MTILFDDHALAVFAELAEGISMEDVNSRDSGNSLRILPLQRFGQSLFEDVKPMI